MKPTLKIAIFYLMACLFSILSPLAQARTWTSTNGKTLKASFISVSEGKITLKRERDGKQFTLPLEKLSQEDRDWVEANKGKSSSKTEPPKAATGIFENRLTDSWEFMEYKKLPFRFYGGKELDSSARYPIFIWLHATGQCGNDNKQQVTTVPRAICAPRVYQKHPSFIIAPHCDENSGGWSGNNLKRIFGIIKEMQKNLPVDSNRIYIMGSSMGGFGVWNALQEEPKLFAAGVPVAGGGSPKIARSIKKVGIWAFHGADDKVVSPDRSREMVEALQKVKGNVKYTEYPGKGHGIAGNALAEPDFIEWLFAQDRSKK